MKKFNFLRKPTKWKRIGEFGVDSGSFLICDPCYVDEPIFAKRINDINLLRVTENLAVSFNESEMPGLAIIGNTGVGDGSFSVYQRTNSRGYKTLKVVFK